MALFELATMEGGQAAANGTNVCIKDVPPPVTQVVLPLSSVASATDADMATVSTKVKVRKKPSFHKATIIAATSGDETADRGVVSGTVSDQMAFAVFSSKVQIEGLPAVYKGAVTLHNGASTNTSGTLTDVTQAVVRIAP